MDIPKPAPPKKKPLAPETQELHETIGDLINETNRKFDDALIADIVKTEAPATPPVVKKPFVPKPHLTQNPFRANPEMQELRKKLEKEKPPVKRRPIRKTSNNSQEKKR